MALRRSSLSTLLLVVFALAAAVPSRDASSQQLPPRPSPAVAYQRLDSLEQAALTGTTFALRLRRLYSRGTVRDSFARASLEAFARNEFRLPRR